MRTILIPTDFTSVPLLLLKHAVTHSDKKLDVIFMYSTLLSSSIPELLFYSPAKIIDQAMNQEFSEGCSIMQNRYPERIHAIRYEVFHGHTANAFKQLAGANKVEAVILAQDYSLMQKGTMFDPTRIILNSGIHVHKTDLQLSSRFAEPDLIASLLTS